MINTINSITEKSIIVIRGSALRPIAKVQYTTEASPNIIYVKVYFEGHRVLVMSPNDELMYFGFNHGDLGFEVCSNNIRFEGENYSLSASDYQIVLKIEFGNPITTEGEVRFWDYLHDSNSDKLISAAVSSRTGQRADVVADVIRMDEVHVQQ